MLHREQIVSRIEASGVVAVIRLRQSEQLLRVAESLLAGGLDCIEFTMTTPGSLRVLEQVSSQGGDRVLFGAGTVLDAETARAAILAGARFVVSPTFDRPTVELCHRYDVAVVPGALTPTEILAAWESGADLVKLFPAGTVGPGYVKAVRAPLPQVKLVPTGGVNLQNLVDYIHAGSAAVAVGAELVDEPTVRDGRWDVLTRRAAEYLAAVRLARAE